MPTMLITGGSTGIGEATARRAVEAGFKVALTARSKDKLEKLVADLGHDNAMAISCDVQDFEAQKAAADAVIKKFGGIDVVLANAGRGAEGAGTEGGDPEEWRQMVLTNILGVMYTVKATHEAIEKAKGHILITSSGAGRKILPGSVYGATKWAMTGYGQNLREEMREKGVKVTLIEPGMVDTPFFSERKPTAIEADDVARAVIYAVSQPKNVLAGEIWVEPLQL